MKASDAVKAMLKKSEMTQSGLAEKIGMNQSGVAMFITRDGGMRVESLLKMTEACDYDVVIVDRKNPKNAFVLGERDTIDFTGSVSESDLDARIRKIVAEEFDKRTPTPIANE